MIPGIDISHWQNKIAWQDVKRSGVSFAYIQATEYPQRSTTLGISPKLALNIQEAGLNAVHWGAYHIFGPHIDPVIQAQALLESVGPLESLPPAVKLEQTGLKAERLNYKVRLFLDEIEKLTGRKALIFTTRSFWENFMSAEKQELTDWARDYPLWISQAGSMWPGPMYPWAGWNFWSHSDSGRLPGIQTHVKMMWFNGSEDELMTDYSHHEGMSFCPTESGVPVEMQSGIEESVAEDNQYRGDFQEKMGGYEPPEIEYVSDQNGDIHSSQPKDSSWIDTYLFQK
jgi:lysozyme